MGYRKDVIWTNLSNSFPEKSEKELKDIAHKFYHYFCDLMIEVIKSISISPQELARRVDISEEVADVVHQYARKKQTILIALAHHGNWEWCGNAFSLQSQHDFYAIYRPLHNEGFNKIFLNVRSRFNTLLIKDKEVTKALTNFVKEEKPSAICFITDQAPSGKLMYWTQFLNQETPVFLGVERYALKFNLPVLYVHLRRVKRGYYQVESKVLVADPSLYPEEGMISEIHTRAIETDIRRQPETWLWTHRRWKRKKDDYVKS